MNQFQKYALYRMIALGGMIALQLWLFISCFVFGVLNYKPDNNFVFGADAFVVLYMIIGWLPMGMCGEMFNSAVKMYLGNSQL
jgi:hypothetical protein